MNIKQALKEKNKLAEQIKQCYQTASVNNSLEEGNVRKYSPIAKLVEAQELTNKLVDLKAKVHKANIPVYDKIFMMSELKGRAAELKRINTQEGKAQGYGYASTPVVRTVEIDVIRLDEMIKEVENKIEKLQEELDVHNAITTI